MIRWMFPQRIRATAFVLLAGFAATALSLPDASSDEVIALSTGGRLQGDLLNAGDPPDRPVRVRTPWGAEIELYRSDVQGVVPSSDEDDEYRRKRMAAPDTVDGHWSLAEWCRQSGRAADRKIHLERIVAIDPENEQARRALGHRRVGDTWLSREEAMDAKGFERYRGRYATSQEVQLREEARRKHLAERQWHRNIRRWRGWLVDEKAARRQQAEANLQSITDPLAVPALVELLHEDTHRAAKLLLMEVLARLAAGDSPRVDRETSDRELAVPQAAKALVETSLYDPDAEVRMTAIEHLKQIDHPDILSLYFRGLRSKDNREVNRAAFALRHLGNRQAIGPLIEAVVTTHKFKIGSGQEGQTSATFSPGGGGGMSFGQRAPTVVRQAVRNQEVLQALVALTGENYQYSVDAWNAWYASHRRSQSIDARRD